MEPAAADLLVPFAGPTFVNQWTLGAYMGDAIMRHPSFKLMPLPLIGSVSVTTSTRRYGEFVTSTVGAGTPYVAAGQSQGGIVAALHALTDPCARHVVLLDSPLHGAWLSKLLLLFPSARELLGGSGLLTELRERLVAEPGRFTSVFCPAEQVMDSASPHLPGITNILVGSHEQLDDFTTRHPDLEIDELVVSDQAVTHTSAMRNPDFRRVLWRIIAREARAAGRAFT